MARNRNFLSLNESISLKGKKTLITGAASGIGKAASLRFAESGSDLLLVDIDKKGLEQARNDLEIFNIDVSTFIIDLSNKQAIDDFWKDTEIEIPDILINNAGIYPSMDYLKVDKDFYEKILDINLNSVFWMCQNFIKARKNTGGIIVNIASIEAVTPFKEEMTHYTISKSGVYALTRSLAHDYGKYGFRVNGVIPGVVKTPGIFNVAITALKKLKLNLVKTGYNYKNRLALGRLGNPDEIAKVIFFLCSDLASYVQGVMMPVDGGFLAS